MRIANRAIPLDSTVVVIGANGYMAVETCEKLQQAGYRVRGTVRSVERHRGWMHALFDNEWPGKFELVEVQDFQAKGAFDEAFTGAAGVIYPSMPIIFDTDPVKVYEPMIQGVVNTLEAAARAGVQRYVLSSSSKAVHSNVYDGPRKLTSDMFNYEAINKVRDGPPPDAGASFEKMVSVYSAGRTLAELAFWDWIREHNSPFVANCVVPDGQFGRVLDMENINTGPSSSTGQLKHALQGQWDQIGLDLAFFTDVQDSARLLVAAVASASIKNERIFSYYINTTWNGMRNKVREMFPDRPELVQGEDRQHEKRDLSCAPGPIARAEFILREVGRPGFASEEDIIRDFVASVFGQV
ncbi:hypothetical protein PG985_005937 [Apiospora marii]|uniref:NAD-dependent epimerase/dehydratase domain-containing protein n=1 Tax=Apiospora marii TaxID=335849 RepID=A0ABR1SC29_9PEZI